MKNTEEIKKQLAALIGTETPKDTIDAIAKIQALIDENENEHSQLVKSNQDLKQDYIDIVKNYRFAPNGNEGTIEDKPLSLEECVAQVLHEKNK